MAGLSNYSETSAINFVRAVTMPAASATVYLALNSADNDAGGSEVTATYLASRGSYTASNFTSPATVTGFREIKNSTLATFGTATTGGSVAYFSIWDAVSGGNCLWTGTFVDALGSPSPLTFGSGDTISTSINGLKLRLSLTRSSIYLQDVTLNWLRGTTAPTAPTTYAGLATAVNPNGTVTEVTSTVRVAGRVTVSAWDSVVTDGDYISTANTNAIDFGISAGTVTSLSHLCFWDASSAGNLLKFNALPLARNIAIGDHVIWEAGKAKFRQS